MKRHLPLSLSVVALLVAVFGSTPVGQAARDLIVPRASVGTAQLKKGAVTSAKVKDRSLLARDFKAGEIPVGPAGPPGPQGAQGPQGPPGPVTGFAGSPAGGDLAGTYPNPTLREGSVGTATVADGSLLLADMQAPEGRISINLPPVAGHSCTTFIQATGTPTPLAGDRAIVQPTANLPLGLVVMPLLSISSPARLTLRVCNVTAGQLDAPEGSWSYAYLR